MHFLVELQLPNGRNTAATQTTYTIWNCTRRILNNPFIYLLIESPLLIDERSCLFQSINELHSVVLLKFSLAVLIFK